jgi:hypothetical protein
MAGDLGSTRIWIGNFRPAGISRTTRSLVLIQTKRGIATDDRNRLAARPAGLAFGRAKTHLSFIIRSLRAFWQSHGFAKRQDLQTQELAKGVGQR